MSRERPRLGMFAAALLVAAGCAAPAPKPAGATPSPAVTASAAALTGTLAVEHLDFTGPAAGLVTSAVTSCRILGASREFSADLESDASGKRLSFSITVFRDFNGAGSYPVGSLLDGGSTLIMTWGPYTGASSAGGGSLVVGADGKSGTVDGLLTDGEHVVGNWACADVTGP